MGCLSGEKVSYGTDMPDLYVCGFTCVAYVLRHAEIRVQGYIEVFNRRHKRDIGVSDVNDRRQRTVDILFESMIMASVLLSFS